MPGETVSLTPYTKSVHITPVAVHPYYLERKRYTSLFVRNLMIKLRRNAIVDEPSRNGQTFIRIDGHQI